MPGHLKEEFKITADQEWKFVSAMTMNYAIITKDSDFSKHKSSALNGVSTTESFKTSLRLLKKQQVEIKQSRRVNKILNTDKKDITYVFNKTN